MKHNILQAALAALFAIHCSIFAAQAADYTVSVSYNGTTAAVNIPEELSSYVTCSSGTSSHVKLVQASTVADDTTGEIIYSLSGTSTDGEFYMEGSYKATIQLTGLTLTNPNGPALNIQNGKRIKVSAKNGTENTLSDGANDDYNGCLHVKGHAEFAGKGALTITGNSKHAVYSKEYVEIKNLTLNILSAQKDGIHCKEYFLMESGTLNISNTGDDGIQVEMDGTTPTAATDDEHEDEDTGNFYMTDGTLTIASYGGKAIKADGTITCSGGTQNFATSDTEQNAATAISSISQDGGETLSLSDADAIYDLKGRQITGTLNKGMYIIKKGNTTKKIIIR